MDHEVVQLAVELAAAGREGVRARGTERGNGLVSTSGQVQFRATKRGGHSPESASKGMTPMHRGPAAMLRPAARSAVALSSGGRSVQSSSRPMHGNMGMGLRGRTGKLATCACTTKAASNPPK